MNRYEKIDDDRGAAAVAALAHEIWNHHFVPIIGQAQVDYMLNRFQSTAAIAEQLGNGYEYYLLSRNHERAGYVALLPEIMLRRMMISKFYVKTALRGYGVGCAALDFIRRSAEKRHISLLHLTVNRYNSETIAWYRRRGFIVVDEVKKDIGGGFYMDDFIMELNLG